MPSSRDTAGRPVWLIPLVVASALFMENMDASVIATSLPAIARDLGEDPVVLKLALTSYLLSLAVFIPISGWCADRYGARRVFQAAIALFVVASIGCALAGTLWQLVLARALQGAGGAMMVPVGRLILLRSVSKSQLVNALAYLTIPALVAPMIGPPLGGFITTYYDWRWIFWINLPIGAAGLLLAHLHMPDVRSRSGERLDWLGFGLSGIGLAALICGFTVAGSDFVPASLATGLMVAGAGLIAAYVVHARRAQDPILDLTLLRLESFRTSVIGGGLFRIGIGAIPFLLPLMLQIGFGLDPFQSGAVTFAGAFGALLMKFTAARILRRFGFRTVLTVNVLICGGFLALYGTFSAATPHWLMFAVILAGGFFRSLQFTALNAVAYADVDERSMSRATAMVAVAQQLSVAAGVALAAFVLEMSRGTAPLQPAHFGTAFIAIAVVTAAAAVFHMRLHPQSGSEVSGHRPARKMAPAE